MDDYHEDTPAVQFGGGDDHNPIVPGWVILNQEVYDIHSHGAGCARRHYQCVNEVIWQGIHLRGL